MRAPSAGLERWVVSYADILTLLFAFFTMLYAISVTDVVKAERLFSSLRESFGEGLFEEGSDGNSLADAQALRPQVLEEQAQAEAAESADQKRLEVLGRRAQELAEGPSAPPGVSVRQTEEGLVISLAEALYFDRGGLALSEQATAALGQVAELLKEVPNHVRIEGHTDDRPASRSNWYLSALRAVAVNEAIQGQGIPAYRLSVSGFADQRPLMSNETPEGRRLNRRVDIVVLRARTGAGDP